MKGLVKHFIFYGFYSVGHRVRLSRGVSEGSDITELSEACGNGYSMATIQLLWIWEEGRLERRL